MQIKSNVHLIAAGWGNRICLSWNGLFECWVGLRARCTGTYHDGSSLWLVNFWWDTSANVYIWSGNRENDASLLVFPLGLIVMQNAALSDANLCSWNRPILTCIQKKGFMQGHQKLVLEYVQIWYDYLSVYTPCWLGTLRDRVQREKLRWHCFINGVYLSMPKLICA